MEVPNCEELGMHTMKSYRAFGGVVVLTSESAAMNASQYILQSRTMKDSLMTRFHTAFKVVGPINESECHIISTCPLTGPAPSFPVTVVTQVRRNTEAKCRQADKGNGRSIGQLSNPHARGSLEDQFLLSCKPSLTRIGRGLREGRICYR